MGTVVRIAPLLQEQLRIPARVEVHGKTIGARLDDLIRQYPEAREWLLNRNELLRVLISTNNEEMLAMNKKSDMDRIVTPTDEILILAILAGG